MNNTDVFRPLDFVVIGAGKSGTTTLFHLLRHHPNIHLPPDKEVPFFSRDDWYERGWQWFAPRYLGQPPTNTLVGTVTPQYMEDPGRVPERLYQHSTDLKLIALLRDPVERAHSLWRMMARLGREDRPFFEVIASQMEPDELKRQRLTPWSEGNTQNRIVVTGEYGSILQSFLEVFPSQQLLVLFTEELRDRTSSLLDDICRFLDLAPDYRPPNLGKRYHVGGSSQRFPGLLSKLRSIPPLRSLWRLLPLATRRRVLFWYRTEATVDRRSTVIMGDEVRSLLVDFYRPDVDLLEQIADRKAPWRNFRACSKVAHE